MESKFKIDDGSTWFNTTDLAWRMNEYDEYAVEQAVQLKEQTGEGDITDFVFDFGDVIFIILS